MDIAIIGSGVIGLSIAIALLKSKPGLSVEIFEKEPKLGAHASGRNSGVIHAGFYYAKDSLKAKFCKTGNSELKTLCKKHQIDIKETGKVVVARNEEENNRIESLFKRGIDNGIEIELLDASQLNAIEPLAITCNRFLWSPTTAITNPTLVLKALESEFLSMGGKIHTNFKIDLKLLNNEVIFKNSSFRPKYIVNAAGAYSDEIARSLNIAKNFAMIPFMGVYRVTNESCLPLKRLVYPVPHPVNPFLGVHFTLTMDNKVKIGPTAIPVLGREQYNIFSGWSLSDIYQTIKGSIALIKGEYHNLGAMLKSEMPKLIEKSLVNESLSLVPSASCVKKWIKKQPGIRSQLVNLTNGKLEQDFIVENFLNSTHVLNAVSPGWTSALPFGRWIAQEKILPNL
jgi:L-2-hydroxyglutarate oxidase